MKILFLTFIFASFLCMAEKVSDAPPDKSKPVNQSADGIAIQGYDPVAYFTDHMPVKGSPEFWVRWRGAIWLFASIEHRDAFFRDPDKYAPQYGGYCVFGVSEGHTAPVDPLAWKVIDGKLYLAYSKKVQDMFLQDPLNRIQKADKNWPNLHK
jgi:YHS domain-containing protein